MAASHTILKPVELCSTWFTMSIKFATNKIIMLSKAKQKNLQRIRKQAIKELTEEGFINKNKSFLSDMRVVCRTLQILAIEKISEKLVKSIFKNPEIKKLLKKK